MMRPWAGRGFGRGDVSPSGASSFCNDAKGTKKSLGEGLRVKTLRLRRVFSLPVPQTPCYGGCSPVILQNASDAQALVPHLLFPGLRPWMDKNRTRQPLNDSAWLAKLCQPPRNWHTSDHVPITEHHAIAPREARFQTGIASALWTTWSGSGRSSGKYPVFCPRRPVS